MEASPGSPEEVPADQQHHADQHGESIVVDVSRLEASCAPRQVSRDRGDAIGAETVDDGAVTTLPKAVSQRLGWFDEEIIVELVEIPLIQKEEIEALETPGEQSRKAGG